MWVVVNHVLNTAAGKGKSLMNKNISPYWKQWEGASAGKGLHSGGDEDDDGDVGIIEICGFSLLYRSSQSQ